MKSGIHPRYAPVVITCMGCGNKIETRSTKGKDFSIDVCSNCHPFYTGRQKFVDSAGRVERFQKKYARVTAAKKKEKAQPAAQAQPAEEPAKAKTAQAAEPAKAEAPKPEAVPPAAPDAPKAEAKPAGPATPEAPKA